MSQLELLVLYLGGRFRRKFFMALPENENDYKQSRRYFAAADSAAQTIAQLSGGTFLMTLLSYVGMRDGTIGTVISLGTIATLFQLLTMNGIQKLTKYKFFVCACVFQRIWFGVLFFIPMLLINDVKKQIIIAAVYLITQIISQLANPASVDWIATLVPESRRGKYFSKKDAIAVSITVLSMFLMGILLDITRKTDLMLGLKLVGAALIILAIINTITFANMKEPKIALTNKEGKELHGSLAKKERKKHSEQAAGIIRQLKDTFRYQGFRKALLLNILWTFSFYIASPFNTSYAVKDLSLSYTYIMTVTLLTTVVRVLLMPRMGRKADTAGNEKMLLLSLLSMVVYYVLMVFTIPGNAAVLYPLSALFSSIGWCYIGIGFLNLQLENLDSSCRTMQYTILSALSGIFGFVISFAAGKAVNVLQSSDLVIAGHKVYAQQITNALGGIILIIVILYLLKAFGLKTPVQKEA